MGEDPLAAAISKVKPNFHFIPVETRVYPDGELCPRLLLTSYEEIKGKDVVMVSQPQGGERVNDYCMRFFLTLDNIQSLNPASLTVIMSYYAYARQDDRFRLGEPISSMFVSKTIENCNVDRVIVVTPHFDRKIDIKAFFPRVRVEIVSGIKSLGRYLTQKGTFSDYIVAAPDEGASEYAKELAREIGASKTFIFTKKRDRDTGEIIQSLPSTVDVKEQHIIIVDDIVSSGSTMINAARILIDSGAQGVGFAYVHALQKPEAVERMFSVNPEFIITTNTINVNDNRLEIASIVDEILDKVF